MTGRHDDWRPTASLEALAGRARLLAAIRGFFAARGVLEVETPLLGAATVTDLHLRSPRLARDEDDAARFLQTSPEFAMKRLLAAGAGPIYQICKAFRSGEAGRRHNPEFTILEWYRPGWDHHRLMDEVDELLAVVLGAAAAERISYHDAFADRLGLDPHRAPIGELRRAAAGRGVVSSDRLERDDLLTVLFATAVEPSLGRRRPSMVFDYPASQAALARRRPGDPPVAERFEVFVDGVELANGYHELTDPSEQRCRFAADLAARRARGLEPVPVDERLLAALEAGLPGCAGVALGVDRLLMVSTGADAIDRVIAFPSDRA